MCNYPIRFHLDIQPTSWKILGLTVYKDENENEYFLAKDVARRLGLKGTSHSWLDSRVVGEPHHYLELSVPKRRRFVPVHVIAAFFHKYEICSEFVQACMEELPSVKGRDGLVRGVRFTDKSVSKFALEKYRQEFVKGVSKHDRDKYFQTETPVPEADTELKTVKVGEASSDVPCPTVRA